MNHKNRHSKPEVVVSTAELRLERWLPLLLVVLGVAVYANGLSGPFVFDDVNLIEHNPRAQNLTTNPKLLIDSGRPLLFYTLAVNYQLGGAPWGYKVFNLAVHLTAALALYGLVRRTLLLPRFGEQFRDSAAGLAFAIAALWVVHPLTTEAVTYIVHRSESMMAMFALLMFYCTVRGAQSSPGWPWYVAAFVAGLLGFGCKQWMIAVPVVLLLYDRMMIGGSWLDWIQRRGAIYAGLLLLIGWTIVVNTFDVRDRLGMNLPAAMETVTQSIPSTGPVPKPTAAATGAAAPEDEYETGSPRRVSAVRYCRSQPGVVLHYLRLVFWPYPLCVDYLWKPADTADRIVPPMLLIGGLLLATGMALWRYPAWGFLGAAFFLLLAPSSSIVPIEDIAVERRMYLPLAAVIALLVMAAWQLLGWLMLPRAKRDPAAENRRRFGGLVMLVVVVSVWGSLTVLRNFDYANDIELWERVVEQVDYSSRARVNLARALTNEAERPHSRQEREDYYERALKYLLEAEKLAKKSSFVQAQIGHVRAQQGDAKEAEVRFRNAIALSNKNPLFHLNLALVLESKGTPGSLDEAFTHFDKAAKLGREQEFQLAEAYNGLGRVLAARQRFDDAIKEYERSLEIDPNQTKTAMNLGLALAQSGRVPEAREQFQRACALDRRLTRAKKSAPLVEVHQGLAELCQSMGRYDEAMTAALEALQLAEQTGQQSKADQLRQLIEQLRTERPQP